MTIDQAESEIKAGMKTGLNWLQSAVNYGPDVVVRNADELQAALIAAYDPARNPAALSTHHRIVLAWNGPSTLTEGPAARLIFGAPNVAGNHLDGGGSVTVVAAANAMPSLANTVYVTGRGIRIQGVGFVRAALAGEIPTNIAAVYVTASTTYVPAPVVSFENCRIGAMSENPGEPWSRWIHGVATQGLAEFVSFTKCRFQGTHNSATIIARACYFDLCDFRSALNDCIGLYNHTYGSDYYAYAWISRTTFRDSAQSWELRDNHQDAVQTGTGRDQHLGYRMLFTDNVIHLKRKFAGSTGGGGPQGFYNSDHSTADNQFVVRRSLILASSPRAFSFHSPNATRPSFMDQCTLMRAGTVPSSFAPDNYSLDWLVGFGVGKVPATGTWMLVTNTVGADMAQNTAIRFEMVNVDPRSTASADLRPETLFKGRDFGRGLDSVNGIAGKFGFALPSDTGTQKSFVADLWANFEGQNSAAGKGWTNPTGSDWLS